MYSGWNSGEAKAREEDGRTRQDRTGQDETTRQHQASEVERWNTKSSPILTVIALVVGIVQ